MYLASVGLPGATFSLNESCVAVGFFLLPEIHFMVITFCIRNSSGCLFKLLFTNQLAWFTHNSDFLKSDSLMEVGDIP